MARSFFFYAILTFVSGLSSPAGAALPPVLKSSDLRVKRVACELYMTAHRADTFVRLIQSGEAQDLGLAQDMDLVGIVHELACLSYAQIRAQIVGGQHPREALESWGGVSVGPLLNTSPADLLRLEGLLHFRPGEKVVDLGSGHGTPSLYFGALDPDVEWVGFEIAGPKVEGARRAAAFLGLKNVHFEQADLGAHDFVLPEADTYYLFNPVFPRVLEVLFAQMRQVALHRPIRVVGLSLRKFASDIDLSWLELVHSEGRGPLEAPLEIMQSRRPAAPPSHD